MQVFRLQHPNTGVGPYISQGKVHNIYDEFDIFWLNDVMDNMKHSPEPSDDSILVDNFRKQFPNCYSICADGYLFGFNNMAKACRWFGSTAILKMMHHYGFDLIVKEVSDDDVVVGESQCMVTENGWNKSEIVRLLSVEDVEDYARSLRNH